MLFPLINDTFILGTVNGEVVVSFHVSFRFRDLEYVYNLRDQNGPEAISIYRKVEIEVRFIIIFRCVFIRQSLFDSVIFNDPLLGSLFFRQFIRKSDRIAKHFHYILRKLSNHWLSDPPFIPSNDRLITIFQVNWLYL